ARPCQGARRGSCFLPTQKIVPWCADSTRSLRGIGMRRRVLLLTFSAVLLVLAGALAARAQSPQGSQLSQVPQAPRAPEAAAYQGPDREQKLIEGAKREKELTFYSSIPADDIAALLAVFDKKYGLKVKAWRADSESILQRVVSESRARRYEADIVAA